MSGVEIRVRSNSRQAQSDLSKLERSVGNIERSAAGVTKAFRNLAIGIGAAFSGTIVTKAINSTTDSLTSMQNRVGLVTGRTKELNIVLDDLYNISRRTGQPVELAAETFNRFGLALSEAGKSSKDILKAVESVNKSIAISGGGVESARAALTQLGQGLASGTLRGEELNSVLEQAPRLAQAIADAMGKPRGALRKLAEEGKLTTEVVFDALLSQSEKLNEEFATIEFTSAEAMITLKDQVGRVVAEISKQLGITSKFTSRIMNMSALIEANRSTIVSTVSSQAKAIISNFQGVIAIVRGLAKIILAVFGRAVDALPSLTSPLRDLSQVLVADVAAGFLYASAILKRFGLDVTSIFRSITDTKFSGAIRKIFRSKSLKDFGDSLYNLGEVIDRYGRRWYNFGNIADKALRTIKFNLFETGVFLGILDQRLIRLRYTSFERFSKAAGVINLALNELKKNVLATNFIVQLQVGFLKTAQYATNFAKAINNLSGGGIGQAFDMLASTFKEVFDSARAYLSKTVNFVRKSIKEIGYYFSWAYDKIIGNSWWTDTMEQTYFMAQKWLPKTTSLIKGFANEVSEIYKFISLVLKSNFSNEIKFNLIVEGIKIKFSAYKEVARELSKNLVSSISSSIATGLNEIREVSPKVASFVSLAFAAGLTKLISPSLFTKTFARIGPLLYISIFTAIVSAFNGAILNSGIFESIARGLGNSIGAAIDTVISNTPKILKALVRVANEFGKGLAETIGNSFLGLPAKILSFLPGGGLLTTILYGGLTASLFFAGIRTAMLGLIRSVVKAGIAKNTLSSNGILSQLFFGAGGVSGQRTKILGAFAGYIVGAELLLGDLIGTSGAMAVGIGATVLQSVVLGDPAKTAFVVSTFNSVIAGVLTRVKALGTLIASQSIIARIMSGSSGLITSAIAAITTSNNKASTGFILSWKKATNSASGFFSRFSTKSIKRLGKIALATAALTAAFATMASASDGSEGEGGTGGAILGGIGFALLAFGDTILSYVLPLLGKLGKSIGSVGATAAKSLGKSAAGALSRMALGAASVVSGVSGIMIAFGAAAAAIAVTATGGLIYSAFFGKGDTFLERVKNNFDGFLAYFDLLNVRVGDVRKSSLKTLKSLERLNTGDIKIKLSSTLAEADLSDSSDSELLGIQRAVKDLEKSRKVADREVSRFGAVTEETRKSIKAAVNNVEIAIKSAGGDGSTVTSGAVSNLTPLFKAVLEQSDQRSGFLERIGQNFGFGKQTDVDKLLKDINDGSFSEDNLRDPAKAIAFAERILLTLGDDFANLPEEFRDAIFQLSQDGFLSADVADAFNKIDFTGFFGEAIAKAFVNGSVQFTDNFTKEAKVSVDEQSIIRGATNFTKRIAGIVKTIEESLGRELSDAEILKLDFSKAAGFNKLQQEITKLEKQLDLDPSDIKDATTILAAGKGSTVLQKAAEDLLRVRAEIALLANQELRISLEPGTVKDINSLLESLNFDNINIKTVSGSLSDELEREKITSNVLEDIKEIERLNRLRASTSRLLFKNEKQYQFALNNIDDDIANINKRLALRIQLINEAENAESNVLSTVQAAASTIDDRDISLNDLLKIDNSTLKKIAEVQSLIVATTAQIAFLGANNFSTAVDGLAKSELAKILEDAQKELNKLFTGIGTSTGETIFEKFVGSLADSGFAFDMQTASNLSKTAIKKLEAPLKLIKKAQDAIKNSALLDSKTRQNSIKIIQKQKDAIIDLLTAGDFQTASIGLEAFGLDPEQVGSSSKTLKIGREIVSLQERLNQTSFEDYDTRKKISEEIEYQQFLLDGLTTAAEASSESIRNAFSEGFKSLLKGEGTIKDFFNNLLDSISNNIINTIVDSFTTAFFKAAGLNSIFDTFFESLFQGGADFGKNIGEQAKAGLDETDTSTFFGKLKSGFSSVISLFSSGLSNAFDAITGFFDGGGGSSIFSSFSGIFSGIQGFGSNIMSSISSGFSSFTSWLGFSEGGLVPSTAYSRSGMDSVPAMLTPGELVVPADKISDFTDMKTKSQQVYNINVSGDVSRQTRKEIVKMLPEITSGVNMNNRENNYRR